MSNSSTAESTSSTDYCTDSKGFLTQHSRNPYKGGLFSNPLKNAQLKAHRSVSCSAFQSSGDAWRKLKPLDGHQSMPVPSDLRETSICDWQNEALVQKQKQPG